MLSLHPRGKTWFSFIIRGLCPIVVYLSRQEKNEVGDRDEEIWNSYFPFQGCRKVFKLGGGGRLFSNVGGILCPPGLDLPKSEGGGND